MEILTKNQKEKLEIKNMVGDIKHTDGLPVLLNTGEKETMSWKLMSLEMDKRGNGKERQMTKTSNENIICKKYGTIPKRAHTCNGDIKRDTREKGPENILKKTGNPM